MFKKRLLLCDVLVGREERVTSGWEAHCRSFISNSNKKHRPIFYQEFIEEESKRRRYWGESRASEVSIRRLRGRAES